MASYKFFTSIPFDFLGTIIKPDWENFKPFMDGLIKNEIDPRIEFLQKEIERLGAFAEKLDLAEQNQLKENEGEPDIGGIKDEQPDETTTKHFKENDQGGSAPIDGAKRVNPIFKNDESTAYIVDVVKAFFQEQIKYRRSYLSYKVYKILDLIEQYTNEISELEKKKDEWEVLKTEIDRRYSVNEYWELRENEDSSEEPFVNSVDWENGPQY